MDRREVLDCLQELKEHGVPVNYEAMTAAAYGEVDKYALAGLSSQEIALLVTLRTQHLTRARVTAPRPSMQPLRLPT